MRIQSIWYGLTLPAQAFKKIISQPKLIIWSAVPIVVTLLLYSVFITQMQVQAKLILAHSMSSWGLNPNSWTASILLFFTKVLLFFISAITFSFISNIVACPFNDFLAERTEAYTTPPLPRVAERSISEKLKLIGLDLLRSLVATGVSLVAVLFSWIPIFNLFALFITFLLISFQFTSYPQTRRGQGFEEGISFLWKYTYSCFGFGAVFTLLFSIPILSSFCLPLAVVGGTLLVARSKGTQDLPALR